MKRTPCFLKTLLLVLLLLSACRKEPTVISVDLREFERERILEKAARYLDEAPVTVTASQCDRSEGGVHDYYSEGDYWWPDPENPDGPYVRRDGESNPDAFLDHRKAMIRLSEHVATLTSALLLTGERKYAEKAEAHLNAWFVDEQTQMNASLLYGQAIKGLHAGRSIGIIDTLHLVEVARSAKILCDSNALDGDTKAGVIAWFQEYLTWMNMHPYGLAEKKHPNNHGVCWSLQAATFADLVGNEEVKAWVRREFKTVYLSEMMDDRGGFPQELKRTKPYGYSLFMIDAMSGIAQLLSTPKDDLWHFELEDGRGMKKGVEFIAPYIMDKDTWFLAPDIMYWNQWPVRHSTLIFAVEHFGNKAYFDTWSELEADPETFEVLRNLPIRHPLLWVRTPFMYFKK